MACALDSKTIVVYIPIGVLASFPGVLRPQLLITCAIYTRGNGGLGMRLMCVRLKHHTVVAWCSLIPRPSPTIQFCTGSLGTRLVHTWWFSLVASYTSLVSKPCCLQYRKTARGESLGTGLIIHMYSQSWAEQSSLCECSRESASCSQPTNLVATKHRE